MAEFLLGSVVECKEGLFFLADEHEAVVIITFNISGELDVGDEEIVVLILYWRIRYLFLLGLEPKLGLALSHWHNYQNIVVSITKFYFTNKRMKAKG